MWNSPLIVDHRKFLLHFIYIVWISFIKLRDRRVPFKDYSLWSIRTCDLLSQNSASSGVSRKHCTKCFTWTHGWNKDCVLPEAICVHNKAMHTTIYGKLRLCWQTSFTGSKLQIESKACCSVKIKNDNILIEPWFALQWKAGVCLSVCLSGDLRTTNPPTHGQTDRMTDSLIDRLWKMYSCFFLSSASWC